MNTHNTDVGNDDSNTERNEHDTSSIEDLRIIKKNYNAKYTRISMYVGVTFFFIYAIVRIIDNLPVILGGIGYGIKWLNVLLTPLFGGFVVAYLLDPVVDFFEKNISVLKGKILKGKNKEPKSSRGSAVAVTSLLFVLIIFIILSAIISLVTKQATTFSTADITTLITGFSLSLQNLGRSIERALTSFNVSTDDFNRYLADIGTKLSTWLQNTATGLVGSISNVTGFFSNILFTIIFAIYFLLDGKRIMNYWDRVLKAITNDKAYKFVHQVLRDADGTFSGYIRGQFLDAIFMAVMVSVSLLIIGVRYAVVIGVMTGIGNLIPYVGPFVAYASTILVCLFNGDFTKLIVSVIVLFIIQTVDGNVINPKLLSSNIDIHPLLVIAALIIGSAIGGLLGMLIAVPTAGLIKIYFEKLIDWRLERKGQ